MAGQVDEVKDKTDIVSVINEHVDLKKAGRNYKGLCPFHGENTPSFMVSQELQIFKCFGCGKGGDVFTFLQEYEGMEFSEALKYLADKAGVKLKQIKGAQYGKKDRLYEINQLALKFYTYILHNHKAGKPVLKYLQQDRGLKLSTIKTFNLGFSPDTPLAMKRFMDKKKVTTSELQEAGIIYLNGNQAYDRFRGRVIFPLFDHRGNVSGFAGRVLPGKDKLAKYINTPETPVYHKSNILFGLNLTKHDIKEKGYAIITEGELDMISTWQIGLKNVVAIKGSALTQEQVRLLSRFTDKLVIALDADFAGDAAAKRGIQIAQSQDFDIKVAELKDYKDPDDAARENPQALKKSISSAKNVWDYLIDSVFRKYNVGSGIEKAKISREVIPILSSITDKIVQAHYLDLVAKRLSVPAEAVIAQLKKIKPSNTEQVPNPIDEEKEVKSRRELMEEYLLSSAFRSDPKLILAVGEMLKTPFSSKLSAALEKYLAYKDFDLKDFSESLPEELKKGFMEIVLKEYKGLENASTQAWEKEFRSLVYQIKVTDIKTELEEVAKNIRRFEKSKKNEKLKKEEERFGKLTKMLNEIEGKTIRI